MGYKFDAEQFCAFYESKGWKVGNQSMKSWKAACVTWHKRNDINGKAAGGEKKDPDGKWFDYRNERYFLDPNGNYYTGPDKFGNGGGYRLDGTHRSVQTRTPAAEIKALVAEILGRS